MDKENAIIVFARHPTPGQVKTRLATGVGNVGAARFYKHCAEKVIQECLNTDATTYIFFSVLEEEQQVRAWLGTLDKSQTLQFMPQIHSPNLGVRLADAFQRTFNSGKNHRRVAVIGTDVPDLESTHLNTAFTKLRNYDTVFGPAEDGGYYLCALHKPEDFLPGSIAERYSTSLQNFFEDITWSTETVLKQNVDNAIRLGLKVAPLDTLPRLRDIDTIEDLRDWYEIRARTLTPSLPPSVTAVLKVASEILTQTDAIETP